MFNFDTLLASVGIYDMLLLDGALVALMLAFALTRPRDTECRWMLGTLLVIITSGLFVGLQVMNYVSEFNQFVGDPAERPALPKVVFIGALLHAGACFSGSIFAFRLAGKFETYVTTAIGGATLAPTFLSICGWALDKSSPDATIPGILPELWYWLRAYAIGICAFFIITMAVAGLVTVLRALLKRSHSTTRLVLP